VVGQLLVPPALLGDLGQVGSVRQEVPSDGQKRGEDAALVILGTLLAGLVQQIEEKMVGVGDSGGFLEVPEAHQNRLAAMS
jgi:hypothetical protein